MDNNKQIEELLSKQRAMCADAFWNNRFGFMDKITVGQCKEMMLYIEHFDAPDIPAALQSVTLIEQKEPDLELYETRTALGLLIRILSLYSNKGDIQLKTDEAKYLEGAKSILAKYFKVSDILRQSR